VVQTAADGLGSAVQMAWQVWWALIRGFARSGILQGWATRGQMQRVRAAAGSRPSERRVSRLREDGRC
jgi:hypothetical protein